MKKLTYSVKEAAEVLGISKSLAYQLAKDGSIPTINLGKRIVIPIQRLEAFIESNN